MLECNLNTSEARKILGSIWTTVSGALLVISGEPRWGSVVRRSPTSSTCSS